MNKIPSDLIIFKAFNTVKLCIWACFNRNKNQPMASNVPGDIVDIESCDRIIKK